MINAPCYRVGSEVFHNRFQAQIRSKELGLPAKFDLFEEAFDKVSWQEPSETWDQLLDRRAIQLASMGRPIILNFSGGTDSYTMYQVFKRNNIKLYGIHLRLKPKSIDNFDGTIEFLKRENPDSRIFILHDTVDDLNAFYDSPEWIWKLCKLNFSSSLSESQEVGDHVEVRGIPDDYLQVIGLDKPRLKIVNGEFYSCLPDTIYAMTMSRPHQIHFYIHSDLPELHVKQSHMLARYIKKLAAAEGRDISEYQEIFDPRQHDYYGYCFHGCGRMGDLARSAEQKIQNYGSTLLIPDGNMDKAIFTGRTGEMFKHGQYTKEKFYKNYMDGVLYVRNDSALRELFLDPENYYSISALMSKPYKLPI